ncbi:cytochrome c [Myxococcota bacterium]|nr:cytochrome c [Myxococcota bacterium]
MDADLTIPKSPDPFFPKPEDVPDLEIDTTLAKAGASQYAQTCLWCHGPAAVSGGMGPDLRAAPTTRDYKIFKNEVVNGRQSLGMPYFPRYSETQIQELFHYIRQEARKAVNEDT